MFSDRNLKVDGVVPGVERRFNRLTESSNCRLRLLLFDGSESEICGRTVPSVWISPTIVAMILQEIYLHNRRQSWKIIVDASDVLACVLLWRGVGVWIGGVGHHLVEDDAPESECILLRILRKAATRTIFEHSILFFS